jgi:hypothetical protein
MTLLRVGYAFDHPGLDPSSKAEAANPRFNNSYRVGIPYPTMRSEDDRQRELVLTLLETREEDMLKRFACGSS